MAKLINGIGKVDLQNVAATKHTFIVIPESKDAESFFLPIPITTDAFKAPGTIVQGMRQNPDLGLRQRHELFLKVGIRWHFPPFLSTECVI